MISKIPKKTHFSACTHFKPCCLFFIQVFLRLPGLPCFGDTAVTLLETRGPLHKLVYLERICGPRGCGGYKGVSRPILAAAAWFWCQQWVRAGLALAAGPSASGTTAHGAGSIHCLHYQRSVDRDPRTVMHPLFSQSNIAEATSPPDSPINPY